MGTERLPWLLGAAAALLAGLALRLWFLHHAPIPAGDAVIYSTIARNLLLHHIYGFNQHTGPTGQIVFEPTLIRLPGYPFFLALVFRLFGIDNLRAVLDVQVAADLLTCILTAALVRPLFGRRAALIVLWLAALCPFTANYTAIVLTEPLVLLTIALALYALYRWMRAHGGLNPWLWITGLALSASLLLRPEQGLFAAAVLPAILWFQLRTEGAWGFSPMKTRPRNKGALAPRLLLRASIPALAAALCIVLPFIPWTVRNWRTFHLFQPLAPKSATDPGEPPSPGFNHWYRTWGLDFTTTDSVYWNIDGDRILPADLPNRAFALGCTAPSGIPRQQLPLYAQTIALLADYNRTTFDPPALDARFEALARRHAAAEPLCNHALLPLGRLANMLLRPRIEILPIPDEWWKPGPRPAQRRFALAYGALNLAYLALGLWGLTRWLRLLRHHARQFRRHPDAASSEAEGPLFRRHPERSEGPLYLFLSAAPSTRHRHRAPVANTTNPANTPGGEAKKPELTQNPCHPERAQRVEEPVLSEAKEPRGTAALPPPHDAFTPESHAEQCSDDEKSRGAPFTAPPHRDVGGIGESATSPNPAAILLAVTIAIVLLRLALLLTLDNSEPRYTLELFPILFLWSAALFTRSVPPQNSPSSRP